MKNSYLDNLWRELVKKNADGKCERCGREGKYLNCHHIFSRSRKSVRWDESNGCLLCAGCHSLRNDSAHKSPLEFSDWIRARRGEKWYQDLRIRANTPQKPDYEALNLYLKTKLKK